MNPFLFALLITYFHGAFAFWRMPCNGRTGNAALDPIVFPGSFADHCHSIHGGNGFGMTTSYDDLLESNCTSCRVIQDKSAYWVPNLYFIHSNGKIELVEQVGGILVYYLLYGENLKPFPNGFRMLAGYNDLRECSVPFPDSPKYDWAGDDITQASLSIKAIGFNCLNYNADPEATLYRHFMPDKDHLDANCANGIRLELMFPSCWDGESLDSDNHRDHMAYPSLLTGGDCPYGYNFRTPTLLFETIWDTYAFKDMEGQFVFTNGDSRGCSYHGDFINGWPSKVLEQAVETCTNDSGNLEDCVIFNLQDEEDTKECFFDMPTTYDIDCENPNKLPVNAIESASRSFYTTYSSGSETVAGSSITSISGSLSSSELTIGKVEVTSAPDYDSSSELVIDKTEVTSAPDYDSSPKLVIEEVYITVTIYMDNCTTSFS